jgi:hypothetical protein
MNLKLKRLFIFASTMIAALAFSSTIWAQVAERGPINYKTFGSTVEQQFLSGDETDALTVWVVPFEGSTSGNSRAPSNGWKYQRTEYLITADEMLASGFPTSTVVNSIGFAIETAGVGTLSGTLNIWLMNTSDVTYTLGSNWTTTGFTQVSTNATFSVPISPAGLYDIPFTGGTPFAWTGGGVYVAWEFSSPTGTIGTTAVVHQCNSTGLANGLYGGRSATSLPTALSVSSFRPATRLGTNAYNDIVAITNIYTQERVPVPFGTPSPINVRVSNVSAGSVSFNLTITVKDVLTSTTRFTATLPVTALAANSSSIISFSGYTPTIQENVNITATTSVIAGEDWLVNNTLAIPANVNNNLFSYNFNTTESGGYGFTYPGTGIFAAKYQMNGSGLITGANVVLYNYPANVGNTVYAVVLNSSGLIVAQSSDYVIQAGDLGTNKNFSFPTPALFTNEPYYIGIAQTAGTIQWYPLGIFTESPQRGNTFYSFPIGGGTPSVDNVEAKYGIEAQVTAYAGLANPTSFIATPINTTQIDLAFTPNGSNNNVVIVWNNTGVFTAPAGTPPAVGQPFAGGTLLYNGITSPRNHTGLTPSTTYYYKAFSYNGTTTYSPGLVVLATTLTPPLVAPFTETFEGTVFPPNGWTKTASPTWVRTTSASGYGTGTASAFAEFYNIQETTPFDLVTIEFNMSALTAPLLKFDYAYATYSGELDRMDVYYSTNNGSTYTLLLAMPGGASGILNTGGTTTTYFVPTAGQWASQSLTLPTGTNKVKFTATSSYGNNLYLDNVKVYQVFANDAGTVSVDVEANHNPSTVSPKATVKNFGTAANTFNVTMTITGGYSSTKTVTSLAPGTTQQVTFDNWSATLGQYTAKVFTQLGTDGDHSNDTLNKNIGVYTGSFTSGTVFPTTTYLGGGTSVNGIVYSIGGNTASLLGTECYKYTVATDSWAPIASLPAGRRVLGVASAGNFIYAIGGSDMSSVYQTTVYKYDISLDSWSTVASMPTALGWIKAVGYNNNKIYVAGGVDAASTLQSSVYVYDVTSDTWATGTSMPGVKFGGAFSVTGNTLVYVGGADDVGISNTVYVGTIGGDPLSIAWTTATDYPGLETTSVNVNQNNIMDQNIISTKGKIHNLILTDAAYPPGTMYRFDGAPWGADGIIVTGGSSTSAWVPANPNPTYIYKPATDSWIKQGEVPIPILGSSIGTVNTTGSIWKLIIASGLASAEQNATQIWTDNLATAPTTFPLSVSINNGWNMVSVPGLHPTNQNVTTWWSGKDPSAGVFRFSGGYLPVTTTTPGQGYWMKNIGANTYNTGDEWPAGGIQIVTHNPITAATGWNLFGGYETTVATSGLTTTPAGLITGSVFKYSSGYTVATSIVPGYGYWVKLTGAGSINIPVALSKGTENPNELIKSEWGKISITDALGKNYVLYAVNGSVDLNNFELPPAPPAGMFDVRFGSDRYAEEISSMQSIMMSGLEYPINIKIENIELRLQDETGLLVNSLLKSGDEINLSNLSINKLLVSGTMIPTVYALEQNYPNPFNPSTKIEFSIPEDVNNVTLTIYNTLGQRVTELVNSKMEAGKYSYVWNASDVATGLYIYELRTDKFVSVKKMMLLK